MRIIAGEFRGRNLLPPLGQATRPITDRVKQSLFDIVTPLLDGASVYDCFAGTGSLGLECLSRGAAHATFFESDRSAIALLRRNIQALNVESRSTVVGTDLFRWFEENQRQRPLDLIFLDPPYRFLREKSGDLQQLAEHMVNRHLAPAGTIVFRHDIADELPLRAAAVFDRREYGGMVIDFLRPCGQS